MASLTPDPKKRDYLLPPGCKELIDVLKLGESRDARFPGAANSVVLYFGGAYAWRNGELEAKRKH